MPRRARLRLPGVPLHVLQRGNDRQSCFRNDRDRRVYLGLLDELGDLYGCAIHAYVLMTNHVHLLLTPNRGDAASVLMKNLGQRYVQYVNRKHGRTGTLWEGRFKSFPVDSAEYFFECQRYVELNPVRAGMVQSPGDYEWSSFATNAWGAPSPLVVPHSIYMGLGATDEERRLCYRSLFIHAQAPSVVQAIRDATKSGSALGGADFISKVEAALGKVASRRRPGRPAKSEAFRL